MLSQSPLLFLFLDGVGLGESDPEHNPFVAAKTPFLRHWLGGPFDNTLLERSERQRVVRRLDATLATPGLPQSATGQTTLLTGKNGAARMGRHYGPWPGPTLKGVLREGTLFSDVLAGGKHVCLANVYPPSYHREVGGKGRVNVPVYAAQQAGVPLLGLAAYRQGQAVSADLTGAYLQTLEPTLPPITPAEAGARLARLSAGFALTFFDYWLSDSAGHRWSLARCVALVEQLDAFLAGLVPALAGVTLLITSDHGNLEDKTTKSHTRNPVPLVVVGPAAEHFAGVSDLMGVAPAVRQVLL